MSLDAEKKSNARLGRVQMRIMRTLWDGKKSAREITDALNQSSLLPVAHSTVQTLLRQLEQKELVAHEVAERTFIFYPLVAQGSALRRATQEFVDRIFGGSTPGLMAHLVEHEKISKKELEEIQQLIDQKRRETR
jgi:BlaI family penicillinase repressor